MNGKYFNFGLMSSLGIVNENVKSYIKLDSVLMIQL